MIYFFMKNSISYMQDNLSIQMKDIGIMNKICSICLEDFTAHSFNKICNTLEGGHIFYTKVSNASRYDDTEGILKHCTNYLKYLNPDKWSWVMDLEGFGLRHTLGLNTGIHLSKLINSFGRLQNLIFINVNPFVEQMLKLIKLTLNKEYHHCICIIHNNNDPVYNKIKAWQDLDNNKHILLSLITS
jgi:hypothetical protein